MLGRGSISSAPVAMADMIMKENASMDPAAEFRVS
jgi:hypothetical protein